MAITGIMLHVMSSHLESVKKLVEAEEDLTVYGDHDGQYLVVVGEIPSSRLEDRIKELESFPGALAAYTTYVNVEDEQLDRDEAHLQPTA